MSFFDLSPFFTWIQLYSFIKKRVMDFQQELLGWLEEATLFPTTSSKSTATEDFPPFSLDDLIDNAQVKPPQNEPGFQDFCDVTDILDANGWMDEKIDLSILDSLNTWLPLPEEMDKTLEDEEPMALESIIDSNTFSSPIYVLQDTVDSPKIESENDSGYSPYIDGYMGPCSIASTSSANDGPDNGIQMPSSPTFSISSNSSIDSPIPDDNTLSNDVSVGDADASNNLPNILCIEVNPDCEFYCETVETTRKVCSPGKDLSLLQRPTKVRPKPYVAKREARRERKKVQNKEAAARYRSKRRNEDQSLAGEVAALEAVQTELKDKQDKLQSEIKYLKSLMREMFKARGVLK